MTPLERAEQDLAEAEQALLEQMARVQGLKERLRFLQECAKPPVPSEADRTTAIVAALRRRAPDTLTIAEVHRELLQTGRSDSYKLVSATLSYLLNEGKIQRPKRGHYTA